MTDIERRLARGVAPELDAALLGEELGRRALDAGLADVAYGSMDSPVGELLVAVTDRGLVRVAFASEPSDEVLEELAARVSPRVLRLPVARMPRAVSWTSTSPAIAARFDLPLDWSLVRGFAQGVLRATAARAVRLGDDATGRWRRRRDRRGPHARPATRWARTRSRSWCPATACSTAGGGLGGYAGGLDRKRYLLSLEGTLPGG